MFDLDRVYLHVFILIFNTVCVNAVVFIFIFIFICDTICTNINVMCIYIYM